MAGSHDLNASGYHQRCPTAHHHKWLELRCQGVLRFWRQSGATPQHPRSESTGLGEVGSVVWGLLGSLVVWCNECAVMVLAHTLPESCERGERGA